LAFLVGVLLFLFNNACLIQVFPGVSAAALPVSLKLPREVQVSLQHPPAVLLEQLSAVALTSKAQLSLPAGRLTASEASSYLLL